MTVPTVPGTAILGVAPGPQGRGSKSRSAGCKLLSARPAGVPSKAMESARRALERSSLQTVAHFGARQTSTTMHSIAMARYLPIDHDLLPALDQKIKEVAQECNSQNWSTTLWAYATMKRRSGEQVLGALEARLEEVSRESTSKAVSNTLCSYAMMGWRPGHRVLGAMEALVEEVSQGCTSQNVTNTLWSYATMGRRPGGRVDD